MPFVSSCAVSHVSDVKEEERSKGHKEYYFWYCEEEDEDVGSFNAVQAFVQNH